MTEEQKCRLAKKLYKVQKNFWPTIGYLVLFGAVIWFCYNAGLKLSLMIGGGITAFVLLMIGYIKVDLFIIDYRRKDCSTIETGAEPINNGFKETEDPIEVSEDRKDV